MKKKFHLTAFTTQEDFKVYQQSKNVDSVTILSFKYFKFLDVFFKKNVNILSLHWVHDHVIHFKKDAQFSVFALYDISRDEILELKFNIIWMRIWAKISFKSVAFRRSSLFSLSRNSKMNFASAWTIKIWTLSQSRINILCLWSQKCWII